jgi:hypothetical protein
MRRWSDLQDLFASLLSLRWPWPGSTAGAGPSAHVRHRSPLGFASSARSVPISRRPRRSLRYYCLLHASSELSRCPYGFEDVEALASSGTPVGPWRLCRGGKPGTEAAATWPDCARSARTPSSEPIHVTPGKRMDGVIVNPAPGGRLPAPTNGHPLHRIVYPSSAAGRRRCVPRPCGGGWKRFAIGQRGHFRRAPAPETPGNRLGSPLDISGGPTLIELPL